MCIFNLFPTKEGYRMSDRSFRGESDREKEESQKVLLGDPSSPEVAEEPEAEQEEDKSRITQKELEAERLRQEKIAQEKLEKEKIKAKKSADGETPPAPTKSEDTPTKPEDNKEVNDALAAQLQAEEYAKKLKDTVGLVGDTMGMVSTNLFQEQADLEEKERVVHLGEALETVGACMEVINNLEWNSLDPNIRKKVIEQRMSQIEADMKAKLGPGYKPDMKDLKSKVTADQLEIKARFETEGYREKTAPFIHDKSAEVGSAFETLKGIFGKRHPTLGRTVLPALAPQTDLQNEMFMKSFTPNVKLKQITDMRDNVISLQRKYKIKMDRLKEGRGLGTFAKEDLRLLGEGIADTTKMAFYVNPQVRFILPVKEALEALLNEPKLLKKLPLGAHVALQAVLGIVNTVIGAPEAYLTAFAAADTRVFYIAFGFLKAAGKGKLGPDDHELFDRINYFTKNGALAPVAALFGIALTAAYFAGSWSGKQMLQQSVKVPRLMVQLAMSTLSAFIPRSTEYNGKELIKAFGAGIQLLLSDLFARDVLNKEGGKIMLEQARKLKDPLAGVDPRNWKDMMPMYHFVTGDTSYESYLRHGTTAWLGQLSQAIFTSLMEGPEKGFNDKVTKSWEVEAEKRANKIIDERVGIYTSLQKQYEALKGELAKCEKDIASQHVITMGVDDEKHKEKEDIVKEKKYERQTPKDDQTEEAELIAKGGDDVVLDVKAEGFAEEVEEGFACLFTPEKLLEYISDLDDNHPSKMVIMLQAVTDVCRYTTPITDVNLRNDLTGGDRIAALIELYGTLYQSYQPPKPEAEVQAITSSEEPRQSAPPQVLSFLSRHGRQQTMVDLTPEPTIAQEEIELTGKPLSSSPVTSSPT